MKKRTFGGASLVVFLIVLSCKVAPRPVGPTVYPPEEEPRVMMPQEAPITPPPEVRTPEIPAPVVEEKVRFEPATLPGLLRAAPGIGSLTASRGDPVAALDATSAGQLSRAFRDAYVEGLYRGIPLSGVLGADRVNRWPGADPSTVVQNWRSSVGANNSWGLPNLVLAMGNIAGDRVFLIYGNLLDAYGRGEGLGNANGPEGYGLPMSDAFPYAGGMAQRFSRGLLLLEASLTRQFIPGPPPASAVQIDLSGVGVTEGGESSLAAPFVVSWRAAVNRDKPPFPPDGPVRPYVSSWGTLYLQTFGDASWGLASSRINGNSTRAFLVESPVLSVLRDRLDIYGFPLTDPYFHPEGMAQRFLHGVLYYNWD